jgi:amino acid adenylation domain-containing protein
MTGTEQEDTLYAPMSFAQRSVWLAEQLAPGHPTYNVPAVLRITGELDDEALEWALNQVVRRHEALRTVFRLTEGEPTQVVLPDLPVRLATETAEPDRLAELIEAEVGICFDLEQGPLLRMRLFRTGSDSAVLVLVMHHLVSDGWSAAILFRELTELYGARRSGQPLELPELEIQYLDFAVWQHEQLDGAALAELRDYWAAQLAGLPGLQLPGDAGAPARRTPRGTTLRFQLPAELTSRIEALGRQHQTSAFTVLLAALYVLLGRYSGQSDLAVSSPVTGRERPEIKGLIGYFVNTLILRTRIDGDPSFTELLGRVRTTCLDAYRHQDLPFDEVVGLVADRPRTGTGQPLTRVMVSWQNLPVVGWRDGDLLVEPLDTDTGTTKDDLSFTFEPADDGYRATLEYSDDLFDPATAEQLVRQLSTLLGEAVANPDRPISRLPLLSPAERSWLLSGVNADYREHGRPWVHELIQRQAGRTPDAPAVLCGEQRLSYAELDQQANALALRLAAGGVGPETVVGLLLPRSVHLVVAMLAVLKAGGAYLPLDLDHPDARLRYILSDAVPAVLITRAELAGRAAFDNDRTILLDGPLPAAARGPAVTVSAGGSCYLNYTSGSTGRPKGVVSVHQGLLNFSLAAAEAYRLTPADRVAQLAALSFDVLVEEVFPVLVSGGAVALPDGPVPWSADELWSLVRRHRVSAVEVTTSRMLSWSTADRAAMPDCLRLIIVGGDVAPEAVLEGWAGWSGQLINSYGVTEASCSSTLHYAQRPSEAERPAEADRPAEPVASRLTGGSLPIGAPYASCRVYLLDQWFEPVPIGVPGELYLGGITVGRGYLNQPGLTAERFVPDPFGAGRLYRTGDQARRLPNGELVFIGRVDEQVKIRGFRVEPSEIEAVLTDHPQVAGCAVVARPDATGTQRLAAFVASVDADTAPTAAELRDFLAERVPRYLIPSVFSFLDRLPVSPSGKLDRSALPEVSEPMESVVEFVAPRTPLEELVAEQWAALLGVPRVGAFDEFFDLGGHSLNAIRFASWARAELDVELPLQALFNSEPTVASVAELLYRLMLAADDAADNAADGVLDEAAADDVLGERFVEKVVG